MMIDQTVPEFKSANLHFKAYNTVFISQVTLTRLLSKCFQVLAFKTITVSKIIVETFFLF